MTRSPGPRSSAKPCSAGGHAIGNDEWAAGAVEQARWRVLRAETSCNFYWGEAWVERCHRDLDDAEAGSTRHCTPTSGVA